MSRIHATSLPHSSRLYQQPAGIRDSDFVDCYAKACDAPLDDAAQRALSFPRWVSALMRLRNALVAPFGLNTEVTSPDRPNQPDRPDRPDQPNRTNRPDRIGVFPLVSRDEHEMILGLDDTHLDFRISILKQDGQIYFATWVRTKNRFGRIYLRLILPFHILIVRNAVARA
ncbi:DUF2867 domain-containing protein [Pseudophaeobacter leonis]|uniref:DUF2867 domain-containing protein n=1 Tax=Pseudophaeobacter leonis TaxID=1144477 RepID=UPI0009F59B59|nr:DUF2867 domain-containing protein [Pseudophaeobacter leonis]